MSRNSEHLSSVYNSNIRLRSELSEYRLWVSNVINGEIAVLILEMLLKNGQRTKVDVEGWAGGKRESRDILSRINPIPLGGVNVVLISGLRPTVSGYISIIKFNLAGNEKLIELGYEMDIINFNLLFKLQIYAIEAHLRLEWGASAKGFHYSALLSGSSILSTTKHSGNT